MLEKKYALPFIPLTSKNPCLCHILWNIRGKKKGDINLLNRKLAGINGVFLEKGGEKIVVSLLKIKVPFWSISCPKKLACNSIFFPNEGKKLLKKLYRNKIWNTVVDHRMYHPGRKKKRSDVALNSFQNFWAKNSKI